MRQTLVVNRCLLVVGLLAGCGDDAVSGGGSSGDTTSNNDGTSPSTSGVSPSTSGEEEATADGTTSGSDSTGANSLTDDSTDSTGPADSTDSTGTPVECGDGIIEADEECDEGPANADDGMCKTDCTLAYCGDGLVGPGEACDDADGLPWNECTNMCAFPTCGDHIRSTGEGCDEGRDNADDGACLTTCLEAECGDGQVWAGVEECDDADEDDTDDCIACVAASCGDGFLWDGVETCDDGNLLDTDACPGSCEPATCGDGFLLAGIEGCDDGNLVDTDACLADCTAASCGDGILWAGVEECDDGNVTDGDGCASDCTDPCGPPGSVIYVDDDAVGGGDGTSWANAYTSVFLAMQAAGSNDELWVAEGEYHPIVANTPVLPLKACVEIYGGFVGNEAAFDERPALLAATVLHGDFNLDDDSGMFADNAFHVIAGASVDNVRVDGVIVTAGNATGVGQSGMGGGALLLDSNVAFERVSFMANSAARSGGGLRAEGSSISVVASSFDGNSVSSEGGGVALLSSSAMLSGSDFMGNTGSLGGGLYARSSTVDILDGEFNANQGSSGGALYARDSHTSISGSPFSNNSAARGGAIYATGSPQALTVDESSFDANSASRDGGAWFLASPGTATASTFTGNTAVDGGGAVSRTAGLGGGLFRFTDSDFFLNTAGDGGGAISIQRYPTVVEGGTFEGNSASTQGGAIWIHSSNGDLVRVTGAGFLNNSASQAGGAIYGRADTFTDAEITDCTFVSNSVLEASADGGAIASLSGPGELFNFHINSCDFRNNSAPGDGGALHMLGPMLIWNSAFRLNTAGGGGGAISATSNTGSQIGSSSFAENSATGAGGGIRLTAGGITVIRNVAMWGNGTDMDGEGNANISYACSEEFLSVGVGNLLAFSDPFVVGANDQLFLDQTSVCVDAGDDALATTDYGALALDWTELTTADLGTLDVSPVDVGVHYDP